MKTLQPSLHNLKDYTVDNDLKKTVVRFVCETLNVGQHELIIENPQVGLSYIPIFFVYDKNKQLKSVVKVFDDPFEQGGHFAKELKGFQVAASIEAKNVHLICVQAIGTCIIDGKQLGLLATSPAHGTNMRELVKKLSALSQNNPDRKKMVDMLARAFKKLGAAMAELHAVQKNLPVHPLFVDRVKRYLDRVLQWLAPDDQRINPKSLQDYVAQVLADVKTIRTTRSIVHGDAHWENFLYDPQKDRISVVDFEAMYASADKLGNPLRHAAFDFFNLLDDFVIDQHLLPAKDMSLFKNAFVQGYHSAGGTIFTAQEEKLFSFVVKLRLLGWLLRMEKEEPEHFASQRIQEIYNFVISEIKKMIE